ncbi:MAG: hypothetical protein HKO03_06605 [Acidimicrobiia bacterium]|nr:hypothetical protein [Acidimicrobiia bacterium]
MMAKKDPDQKSAKKLAKKLAKAEHKVAEKIEKEVSTPTSIEAEAMLEAAELEEIRHHKSGGSGKPDSG